MWDGKRESLAPLLPPLRIDPPRRSPSLPPQLGRLDLWTDSANWRLRFLGCESGSDLRRGKKCVYEMSVENHCHRPGGNKFTLDCRATTSFTCLIFFGTLSESNSCAKVFISIISTEIGSWKCRRWRLLCTRWVSGRLVSRLPWLERTVLASLKKNVVFSGGAGKGMSHNCLSPKKIYIPWCTAAVLWQEKHKMHVSICSLDESVLLTENDNPFQSESVGPFSFSVLGVRLGDKAKTSPFLKDSLFAGRQIEKRVTRVALPRISSREATMAARGRLFAEETCSVTAVGHASGGGTSGDHERSESSPSNISPDTVMKITWRVYLQARGYKITKKYFFLLFF